MEGCGKGSVKQFVIPGVPAWGKTQVNTLVLFKKKLGREPDEKEKKRLLYVVKYSGDAFKVNPPNRATYENARLILNHYLRDPSKGLPSKDYVDRVLAPKALAKVPKKKKKFSLSVLVSAALDVVNTALPIVQSVLSVVPGVGTAVNVAIEMGKNLASGRPLSKVFVEGLKGAIPGGPIAQTAFNTAVALAEGKRIDQAALDTLKSRLPPIAQKAVDVGIAVGEGRKLQHIAISQIKDLAPKQIKELAIPIPKGFPIHVPKPQIKGFSLGLGVLEKKLSPVEVLAVRKRLKPVARKGFDRALTAQVAINAHKGSKNVPKGLAVAARKAIIQSQCCTGVFIRYSTNRKLNGRLIRGKFCKVNKGTPGATPGIVVDSKGKKFAGLWKRA